MITDRGLEVFAPKASELTEICLDSCSGITDDGLLALARYCPYLSKVEVSMTEIPKGISMEKCNGCSQPTDISLGALLVNN